MRYSLNAIVFARTDYLTTGIPCGAEGSLFTNTDCMASVYDDKKAGTKWAIITTTTVNTDNTTNTTTGPTTTSGGCASADAVCKNIMYQSRCGALSRWSNSQANAAAAEVAAAAAAQDKPETGGTFEWAIFGRREIYWDPECEVR